MKTDANKDGKIAHRPSGAIRAFVQRSEGAIENGIRGMMAMKPAAISKEEANKFGIELAVESHKGNPDMDRVNRLISQGADLNATYPFGQTALITATIRDNSDLVAMLSTSADVNAEAHEQGRMTALLFASQLGNCAIIKILLDGGARMAAERNMDRTPLMLAAANGKGDAVRLLLDRGADPAQKDHYGLTAEQIAYAESIKNMLRNAVGAK